MRRIAVIGVAVAALVTASVAFGALNTYTAKFKFSGGHGSAKKPAPVSFTQDYTAKGTGGNRTATLLDLKTSIYGLKSDGKDFPTCSLAKISKPPYDSACPKKALVATGYITAVLGSQSNFQAPGTACDPLLHVWNGGPGKLVFFFADQAPNHECLGGALKTGQVGPYPGTVKKQGKYLVVDVKIPKYVDFPTPGLVGSLETEHLKWLKVTKKVHGKTVAATSSVGCLKGKRPYKVSFKATLNGHTETSTVKGSAKC